MLCNIHGSSDVFHEMHLASASIIYVHNDVIINVVIQLLYL